MSWFQRLERRLDRYAIPNLIVYILIGQTFVYLAMFWNLVDLEKFMLVPARVMDGEWWLLVTFAFDPPKQNWMFIAFALYFLYMSGNALEEAWGSFRFNCFLLVGYVLTVAAAFLFPFVPATNVFIGGSIFLAFAHRFPNTTMYLFFIVPVQIKWLALVAWVVYAWKFVEGTLPVRVMIMASLANFFLFVGRDLWLMLRDGQRRLATESRRMAVERAGPQPRHRCFVCGKTDLTDPQMDFRYCSKCAGDQCYCPDHIRNHEHVLTDGGDKETK